MPKKKYVVCCPKCKKPVEAKDYLSNPAVVGFLESVLPTIDCSCGYYGLPIKMALSDYEKWRKY